MNNQIITLSKFLSRYLMMSGDGLKKLSHKDIKVLFPNIKRCSFEDAKILYLEGKAVYVTDGKNIVPYIVPKQELENSEYTQIYSAKQKQKNKRSKNYTDMSIDELLCLLNTKFNKQSTSRKAREELEDRGYTLKRTYKVRKYKEIIQSIEIYE